MLSVLRWVDDLKLNFSQWLMLRRRELRLSQEGLGEQLGVSRQTVNNWESGRVIPRLTVNEWLKFCAVLQVEKVSDVPEFELSEESDR